MTKKSRDFDELVKFLDWAYKQPIASELGDGDWESLRAVGSRPAKRRPSRGNDGYLLNLTNRFHGKNFSGGELIQLDLSALYFDYSSIGYAHVISCDLTSTRIKGRLSVCKFVDTLFNEAEFESQSTSSSLFLRCSFRNAVWRSYRFEECWFEECDLTGLTFQPHHLGYEGTTFRRCKMSEELAESLRSVKALVVNEELA